MSERCAGNAGVTGSESIGLGQIVAFALEGDGWAPQPLSARSRHGVRRHAMLAVAAIGGLGIAAAAVFGWGTDSIVFVSSVLVPATYLPGVARAVRLLSGCRPVTLGHRQLGAATERRRLAGRALRAIRSGDREMP